MSAPAMTEKLYTIEEVAKILELHRNTVKKRIEEGDLVAIKVGREYRIRPRDLEDFMERNQYRPKGQ